MFDHSGNKSEDQFSVINNISMENPKITRGNFLVNFTTTGGFASTFKSIIYNSSDNIIIEIGGFPKHIEGERNLTSKEKELPENIIIKNNFFQTRLQDYTPCCDLKYFNLSITFDDIKNSVSWISGSSVPDNILKIAGTFENLTSYKNES
jgi:hypothetical protein